MPTPMVADKQIYILRNFREREKMSSQNSAMYSVIYTLGDAQYNITDTEEIHSRLRSDEDFLLQYVANGVTAPELVSIVDETSDNICTESVIKNFTWTKQATKLFLNSYLNRKDSFRNPKVKKKSLWAEILQVIKENGYTNLNEDLLDRKMRNMKKSYKNIKDNNKKSSTGRGRVLWEYYDIFEDIFANDITINCSSTLSSMQKDNEITSESVENDHEVTALTRLFDSSNNSYHNLTLLSHAEQNVTTWQQHCNIAATSQQHCNNMTTVSQCCCNIPYCIRLTLSLSPFQPIHPVSPGTSSTVSTPLLSITSSIIEGSKKAEKSTRMNSLYNIRKK